ncbi:hypothetical protein FEM03_02480 [Phragmitibacter flavus]|uniref:Ribosomal RNA methyltransferase FtsJ domain-containing protein n=1 Tax=Phragmitibacter flavus TaxID=2576071 RepID=A0A5R8KIV5_9BACT|nr:SAM-dependent methyltransferase [Phragmitibacter flavus]TLD72243.1 hypothetical protein FEM03_02480 [Phragmitibacter flavus]
MDSSLPTPAAASWLIRIPELFSPFIPEILQRLATTSVTKLGNEYFVIKLPDPSLIRHSPVALFITWNVPIHHSWPCNPQKMEGFVEKAALTLAGKFQAMNPQSLLISPLLPGLPNSYYKSLASNLRGRALQLFEPLPPHEAEEQDSTRPTLFCFVGKEGLFAGIQSPKQSNGFYAGGTRYIRQEAEQSISRAGAKVAEALHYLRLYRPEPAEGSRWLELGASPGGMTSELLARKQRVTAIDRAPLEPRLNGSPGLSFVKADVATFKTTPGFVYDALLCDLNGDPHQSIKHVIRLSDSLCSFGLIIFTLKTPGADTLEDLITLHDSVVTTASKAGLTLLASTHLNYNRQEFTLFFQTLLEA